MKIDKHLNLVIPIQTDTGLVYIHSAPISRECFEQYFLVISKTFAAIHAEGLGSLAGPRIAYLMLKEIATQMGKWKDVEHGLINEITRLSNAVLLTSSGWKSVPMEVVKTELSEDDFRDFQGYAVFFICVSAMHKKAMVEATMAAMSALWDTLITSLDCTEFVKSLPTSTEIENTGENQAQSSIPA